MHLLPLVLVLCGAVGVLCDAPEQYRGTVYLHPCQESDRALSRSKFGDLCPHFKEGVEDPTEGAAYGMFEDGEYAKADGGTGWGVLYVNTNEQRFFHDDAAMYAAGYLEGALTSQQIKYNLDDFQAQYFNNQSTPANITAWAKAHMQYLRNQISSPKDEYWSEVALVVAQLDGLLDGYNDNLPDGAAAVTDIDMLILNMDGDLLDIMPALNFTPTTDVSQSSGLQAPRPVMIPQHCSSLIRVLPNNTDLFIGHDTWSSYMSMVRIYKHYNLPLQRDQIRSHRHGHRGMPKARQVSFSAYPGFLSSVDDWYITNNGLIVAETTNNVYNMSLYKLLTPTGVVMSFMRAMIANALAQSGPEWVKLFSEYNSGTYNNQWMVTDLKLFQPGQPLPDNLLTIAEQIPGYIHSGDVTSVLREQGYWASYNVPYFPDIFTLTGYAAMEAQHGNSYSHSNCSRALIFARDAPKVQSYEAYQSLMRYNDFKNDPYSNDDASNSIAARYDLNATNPSPSGAIDSKTTSWRRALERMSCDAMNGPTHDQQTPFTWIGQWNAIAHEGQPDLFDFDPIEVAPDMYPRPQVHSASNSRSKPHRARPAIVIS